MACLSTGLCSRIRRRRVAALSHKLPKEHRWNDIAKATSEFSVVIGYGGFSTVYLAGNSAVKAYTGSEYLYLTFKKELDLLLSVVHPNIVNLRGYCDDKEQQQGALVLDYFPRGTLADNRTGLPLNKRLAIAFQLSLALNYLHERCIVHGDVKASNLLLDDDFNCKLCDFGSATRGLSSSAGTSRQLTKFIITSPGYTDPHYLKTGVPVVQNDIYSYGVVLLELLTGKEAFSSDTNLPLTCGIEHLQDVLEPGLECMLSLARRCLHFSPNSRPSANQISEAIKGFMPSVLMASHPLQLP